MEMTDQLSGQVALVTGGGRGIGRGIAVALATAGASVAVSSRTSEQVQETVRIIERAGGKALAVTADVEQDEQVRAMVAQVVDQLGPIDLLINNAGATSGAAGPFETLDVADIRSALSNNMISAMLCTRHVLPDMLARAHGRIVNVASGSGIVAQPFMNIYSVAKAGLIRFSENLAMEVGDRGVLVFSMTPGAVLTQATAGFTEVVATGTLPGWLSKAYGPPHENMANPSTFMTPERAGELCVFLAEGKADRLSGCFFSSYYDEAEIVANAERVRKEMLYTLRLETLQGVERATTPAEIDAAMKAGG